MPAPGAAEETHARLARVRHDLGLSLRAFAQDVGERTGYSVSHDSVRQYEHGRSIPADYVKALCRAYGLSADWLLFGSGERSAGAGGLTEQALDEMADVEGRWSSDDGDTRTLMEQTRLQWERFVDGLEPDHPLRPMVLAAWQRSRSAGVEARTSVPPRHSAEETRRRVERARPLLEAARPHVDWMREVLGDLSHVVYLTDADGVVVHSAASSDRLLDEWSLRPGFDWSEAAAGSNGAGTALATGRVVAVIGSEHYAEAFQQCVCLASPLRGPDGELVGALDVSTPIGDGIPRHLTAVTCTARMIEEGLKKGGP